MNPFQVLLRSRKFWIMIVDVVVSTAVFFLSKYASESALESAKFLIAVWQPVVLLVIGAIAYEDGQTVKAMAISDAATITAKSVTDAATVTAQATGK